MPNTTYRVGLLSYQIIGAVCVIFFAGCGVAAFLAKQYGPITIFAVFVLMGLYMIVSAGTFELSNDSILHQCIFGSFQILWSDIRQIECGTQGSLILHGENKRFALPSPAMWSGKQKPEAFELLHRKVEELGVITYPSNVADYKIHKNVRVR